MIRIAATCCFLLTLLCPVFCLAEADGDGCAERGRGGVENCEAMAVGAVVTTEVAASTSDRRLPALDGLGLAEFPVVGPCRGVWEATRGRAIGGSPTAARRRALLQTFLF